jgi:hypothetical protein
LVGSLMYAIHTHPEIQFPLGQMSRAVINPSRRHWALGMRILRYLKGAANKGLVFTDKSHLIVKAHLGLNPFTKKIYSDCKGFVVFADADWGGDIINCYSTRGFVIYYNGNVVSTKSKLNKTISVSASEAELTATALATQEVIWLQILAEELKVSTKTLVLTDNTQVKRWIEEPNAEHARSKHLNIAKRWLAEKVRDAAIEVSHVGTEKMVADIFTKSPGTMPGHCKTWTTFADMLVQ